MLVRITPKSVSGRYRNGCPDDPEIRKRKGGYREMADILALVLQYPEAELEQAIVDSLKSGYPCKEHVINCLSRLHKDAPAAPVSTPEQLILTTEPKADTQRYDKLRGLH